MGNRPRKAARWMKVPQPPSLRPEVMQYAMSLSATGISDREVARAALYAEEYGLDALSGEGCVTFGTPSCGDWGCVKPDHQVVNHAAG